MEKRFYVFFFFMLHSTQTSKQHFKKNIVLPEVFLNSGSVRLKLNKLMKHSIFHYRQCYPSCWVMMAGSPHEEHALYIFKICSFLRISYMCTVFISFLLLPLSPPYPLLTHTFWIYGLFFFNYYCYMCVCVSRKVDGLTDRQAVSYLTYCVHLVSFICTWVYSADCLGLGNLSRCFSLGKTCISCTYLNLYI